MQRQETSHDDFSSAMSVDRVLGYLERHSPQLHDEVSMVLAMFEEARVGFLMKGGGSTNTSKNFLAKFIMEEDDNSNNNHNQQHRRSNNKNEQSNKDGARSDTKAEADDGEVAVTAAARTEESENQSKSNQQQQSITKNNTNNNKEDDDFAIAVHVPLRTLEGDGASTLAHVLLSIVLESPEKFPHVFELNDHDHNDTAQPSSPALLSAFSSSLASGSSSSSISIRFKSMQLAPSLRADLADSLLNFARELQQGESLTIAALATRAEEMLLNLPVAVQSQTFGCCLNCNKLRLQSKQHKVPQPIRISVASCSSLEKTGAAAAAATPVCFAANNEDCDAAQCLLCKSQLVVYIPSMMPTKKSECSFCFCEDHPLVTIPGCQCISCFDCFIRFAEIAIGAKQLRRPTFGFRGFGLSCPSHPRDAYLNDPGLLKLLPGRALLRFNSFAVKELVQILGGFICANPECGVPQIPSWMKRGLAKCLICDRGTCLQCHNEATRCDCEQLEAPVKTSLSNLQETLYRNECIKCPIVCTIEHGNVMFILGKTQAIIEVPFHEATWRQWTDAHVWQDVVPPRKLSYSDYLCVFNGVILRADWTLAQGGVFPGSVVYLVPLISVVPAQLEDEVDLWKFRREIAKSSGADEQKTSSTVATMTKKCPSCKKAVAHFWGHGCHHIGAHGTCCGFNWCWCCNGPYPCRKCPVFCNDTCGCPPCPECRIGFPCDICDGCSRCKTAKAEFS